MRKFLWVGKKRNLSTQRERGYVGVLSWVVGLFLRPGFSSIGPLLGLTSPFSHSPPGGGGGGWGRYRNYKEQ